MARKLIKVIRWRIGIVPGLFKQVLVPEQVGAADNPREGVGSFRRRCPAPKLFHRSEERSNPLEAILSSSGMMWPGVDEARERLRLVAHVRPLICRKRSHEFLVVLAPRDLTEVDADLRMHLLQHVQRRLGRRAWSRRRQPLCGPLPHRQRDNFHRCFLPTFIGGAWVRAGTQADSPAPTVATTLPEWQFELENCVCLKTSYR